MLVEVIVGFTVFMVAILSYMAAFGTGSRSASRTNENMIAYQASTQVFENLRTRQQIGLTNGTYNDATLFGNIPLLSSLKESEASVTIANWSVGGGATTQQVSVTIRWKPADGNTYRTKTTTTLFSKKGFTL